METDVTSSILLRQKAVGRIYANMTMPSYWSLDWEHNVVSHTNNEFYNNFKRCLVVLNSGYGISLGIAPHPQYAKTALVVNMMLIMPT